MSVLNWFQHVAENIGDASAITAGGPNAVTNASERQAEQQLPPDQAKEAHQQYLQQQQAAVDAAKAKEAKKAAAQNEQQIKAMHAAIQDPNTTPAEKMVLQNRLKKLQAQLTPPAVEPTASDLTAGAPAPASRGNAAEPNAADLTQQQQRAPSAPALAPVTVNHSLENPQGQPETAADLHTVKAPEQTSLQPVTVPTDKMEQMPANPVTEPTDSQTQKPWGVQEARNLYDQEKAAMFAHPVRRKWARAFSMIGAAISDYEGKTHGAMAAVNKEFDPTAKLQQLQKDLTTTMTLQQSGIKVHDLLEQTADQDKARKALEDPTSAASQVVQMQAITNLRSLAKTDPSKAQWVQDEIAKVRNMSGLDLQNQGIVDNAGALATGAANSVKATVDLQKEVSDINKNNATANESNAKAASTLPGAKDLDATLTGATSQLTRLHQATGAISRELDAVDSAVDEATKHATSSSGIIGKSTEWIPGTPAYEQEKRYQQVMSNAATRVVNTLKALGDGHLGFRLTNNEIMLFAKQMGVLDIGRTHKEQVATLRRMKMYLQDAKVLIQNEEKVAALYAQANLIRQRAGGEQTPQYKKLIDEATRARENAISAYEASDLHRAASSGSQQLGGVKYTVSGE